MYLSCFTFMKEYGPLSAYSFRSSVVRYYLVQTYMGAVKVKMMIFFHGLYPGFIVSSTYISCPFWDIFVNKNRSDSHKLTSLLHPCP